MYEKIRSRKSVPELYEEKLIVSSERQRSLMPGQQGPDRG